MRIRIVDAFTDRPFTGNPAGVLLLDAFPDDTWLQHVAREVNLSETAFAHPPARRRRGRLGAALVHARHRGRDVRPRDAGHRARPAPPRAPHSGPVRFATRSGVLVATPARGRLHHAGLPDRAAHSGRAPRRHGRGAGRHAAHRPRHRPGHRRPAASNSPTRRPSSASPPTSGPSAGTPSAASSPPPAPKTPSQGYDFVSRCFFPNVGIDEDPVTGSAHTALAPFWSARLGRPALTGLQASARSGLVRTALRGDRTLLTGRAVTVIEGELLAVTARQGAYGPDVPAPLTPWAASPPCPPAARTRRTPRCRAARARPPAARPGPSAGTADEDHAHHHVADEAADALVEVVRAAQHRTGHQRGRRASSPTGRACAADSRRR